MTTTELSKKESEYRYVASLLDYNEESGLFIWKKRNVNKHGDKIFNTRFSGKVAGSNQPDGYVQISAMLNGKVVHAKAHRLAWLMVYGEMPKMDIDHINQVRDDNRIENLRDVPRYLNQRNQKMRSNNTSGFTGVFFDRCGSKWTARVNIGGKFIGLGRFVDINEAAAVVRAFRDKNEFSPLHGVAA